MNFESMNQYLGKVVKLTLLNGFWYKAKIISVDIHAVTFIELRGRTVSVEPSNIILCEEVSNGN